MSFQSLLNRVTGQPENYKLKSQYTFQNTLGAGTFGVVKRATHIPTGEAVAIKIILKKNLHGNEQMVMDELDLLKKMDHPHIVRFKAWFESKEKYYIVTQLATGGELFDRICDYGKFTEKDGVTTIKEILGAIQYLHQRDIVHRDLKPENLLYLTSEPDSSLVLADFGIAKSLSSPDQKLKSMAGSFGYAAPEVLLGTGHGKPCDIWSLGVITYTILSGYSPFRAETIDDFLSEVEDAGFIIFHERYWKTISPEAKDFITKTLNPNPEKRPSADALFKHPWIADLKAANSTENLLPNIREGFNARRKLKKGIEAIRLANHIASINLADKEEEEGTDGAGAGTTPDSPKTLASIMRKSKSSGDSFAAVVMSATRNKDLLKEEEAESK